MQKVTSPAKKIRDPPNLFVNHPAELNVVLDERGKKGSRKRNIMAQDVLVPGVVFFTIGWIAWVIFSSIRRYMIAKFQAGVQSKLLDKVDSSQALLSYAETEAGRKFIDALTVEQAEPMTPYRRILTGVQVGITLVALGIGLLLVHSTGMDSDVEFTIFGTLAVALGVGLGISAAACYFISRSMGLLQRRSNS